MRVPVFEEIIPASFEESDLQNVLIKEKVGRNPSFLSLLGNNEEDCRVIARRIQNILAQRKLSSRFPYPFILITEHNIQIPEIETVSTIEELPIYYLKKIKKLNNKELSLLNKVLLLNEKVSNLPLYDHQERILAEAEKQKELYNLIKEKAFYERVYFNL